jgi:hypothetical protein
VAILPTPRFFLVFICQNFSEFCPQDCKIGGNYFRKKYFREISQIIFLLKKREYSLQKKGTGPTTMERAMPINKQWNIIKKRVLTIYKVNQLFSLCFTKVNETRHHRHAGLANREDVVHLPTVSTL